MHDARCEHSKTKRCRCDCNGAQHGAASTAKTGTSADEQPPGVLNADPVPPASNLGIHHWFEAWVSA